MTKVEHLIPCVKISEFSNENSGWILKAPDEFFELVCCNGKIESEVEQILSKYLKFEFSDFRFQQSFLGIELLVTVLHSAKEVLVSSARLNIELNILHQLVMLKRESLNECKPFIEFKDFVQSIAQVDITNSPLDVDLSTVINDLTDLQNRSEIFEKISESFQSKKNVLYKSIDKHKKKIAEIISDKILDLVTNYDFFRIPVFRFIAMISSFEMSKGSDEVKRALSESTDLILRDNLKAHKKLPLSVLYILKFVYYFSLFSPSYLVAVIVRVCLKKQAKRFIAGNKIPDILSTVSRLKESSRDVTLDIFGEMVLSESDADSYTDKILKVIDSISSQYEDGECNLSGIYRAHITLKISSVCSNYIENDYVFTRDHTYERLKKIFIKAKDKKVFVNIDAEDYKRRDTVFSIYKELLLKEDELKDFNQTGIAIQCYLKDSAKHFFEILELSRIRGIKMPVRLLKGSFYDQELTDAQVKSHASYQFRNNEESDLLFRQLILETLKNSSNLILCIASHNVVDHLFAESIRKSIYPESNLIEHATFHMAYEPLSLAMVKHGWVVRDYVPVGKLLEGIAYLVNRIMENSSQLIFLDSTRQSDLKRDKGPDSLVDKLKVKKDEGRIVREESSSYLTRFFVNNPSSKLYKINEQEFYKNTLSYFKKHALGKEYTNVQATSDSMKDIFSPNDPSLLVGRIFNSDVLKVKKEITTLYKTFNDNDWSDSSIRERAMIFDRLALKLIARRTEFVSLIVFESGKTLDESIAEVNEAIDFCNYYSRQAVQILKGETEFSPRGVVAVISPSNSPLATPFGTIAAALLTANHVVFKPAQQRPLVASKMVSLFREVGISEQILLFVCGDGETIGKEIIRHPRVSLVSFTGEKDTGIHLFHTLSAKIVKSVKSDKIYPVKIIAEMGGNNGIVVTSSADIDLAIKGVLSSCLSNAGQKCSSCSRIIVDQKILPHFRQRLVEAFNQSVVGRSDDLSTIINPVISTNDISRLSNIATKIRNEVKCFGGNILVDRVEQNGVGNLIGPLLVEISSSTFFYKSGYFNDEIFGPFVYLIPYSSKDEALKLLNGINYGFTAGIYSQSHREIEWWIEKAEAGNIYVNRNITDVRVGVEPFGGMKMSGTGPKTGSNRYLKAFMHVSSDDMAMKFKVQRGLDGFPELLTVNSEVSFSSNSGTIERLINSFESLFPTDFTGHKDYLVKLKEFFMYESNLKKFKVCENYKIPGVLSYNIHTQTRKRIVLIAGNERPSFATFFYAITAISFELPITILAFNQSSYKWYLRVVEFVSNSAIFNRTVSVHFVSQGVFRQLMGQEMPDVILFDAPLKELENLYQLILSAQKLPKLPRVVTPYDHACLQDIESVALEFFEVRSVAQNITYCSTY